MIANKRYDNERNEDEEEEETAKNISNDFKDKARHHYCYSPMALINGFIEYNTFAAINHHGFHIQIFPVLRFPCNHLAG